MIKKLIYFSLILFLLADIGFSFKQHYSAPLDGDMAGGIVPANDVKTILDNPFGTAVLFGQRTYPNPNRFFSHWMLKEYFNSVPFLVQKFVEPITSIYLSCAIAKTLIQVILIFLLAIAITGTTNVLKFDFLVSLVLIAPLFQTNGYYRCIGIIDHSITYTFFYALPCALLLLYLTPVIFQFYHRKKPPLQILIQILWIPLAIVVCLSGPLNPAVVLIFSVLVLVNVIGKSIHLANKKGFIKKGIGAIVKVPKGYWFYLLPVSILSLYSLYIGSFNSLNSNQFSLTELYAKIPEGIYYLLTHNPGFSLLMVVIIINAILISKKYKTSEGYKILNILKWIGVFSLLYIMLLPLGGYRSWRPNIIRYDTMMPISLSFMFAFGVSTLFLFKTITSQQKRWYIPAIIVVLLIYTISDEGRFDKNRLEKMALKQISESTDTIVPIQDDCTVLSWGNILKPGDSELNAQLLLIWKITDKKKLYYNK